MRKRNMDNSSEDQSQGIDKPLFSDPILIDYKAQYIKKPKHYAKQDTKICIICKIVLRDKDTESFEIYRDEFAIVFLNIYPYQVGHLLVSPLRHVMGYEELNDQEIKSTSVLVQRSLQMLTHFGRTESFNVGWNQGNTSGGSIKHNHIHVVPRYPNELNFFEIIAKTKPIIQSLEDTYSYLFQYREFLAGNKSIEELAIKSMW